MNFYRGSRNGRLTFEGIKRTPFFTVLPQAGDSCGMKSKEFPFSLSSRKRGRIGRN